MTYQRESFKPSPALVPVALIPQKSDGPPRITKQAPVGSQLDLERRLASARRHLYGWQKHADELTAQLQAEYPHSPSLLPKS